MRARRMVFAALLAVYLAAPLVQVGGHPAIFLDAARRRFFLLGATFDAQDLWIVALLILALVFTLLAVTTWRGRLWCGWACPQTVFLEFLYRPIERLFDGTIAKHAGYVAVSMLISHTAMSLFVSTADLATMVREGPGRHPVAFTWAAALTLLLYANYAWFREQVCVVLCPYGRLQSVPHDRDSIVLGYDARRGEPRGPLRRLPLAVPGDGAGDCIDCKKCVWACPTGIDIRNGLQMECIACAQCADACDEVMRKIGRGPGLIRYTSQSELEGKSRRVLRPRLVVYVAAAVVAVGAAATALAARTPFEATVVRPPGVPWVVEGTRVRNQVEVHLTNKSGEAARFRLAVEAPVRADVRLGAAALELAPLADARVPLVITVDRCDARPGLAFTLVVDDETAGARRTQPVRFVAPLR